GWRGVPGRRSSSRVRMTPRRAGEWRRSGRSCSRSAAGASRRGRRITTASGRGLPLPPSTAAGGRGGGCLAPVAAHHDGERLSALVADENGAWVERRQGTDPEALAAELAGVVA